MTLRGFVTWCVERKALASDPLRGLRDFDTTVTPENYRRALTLEEVAKLLAVTPEPRRMLYRLALVTGFRSGEIRSLRVGDLDSLKRTVTLRSANAKDRRDAVATLPADMAEALAGLVAGRSPEAVIFPDLYPAHAARRLEQDLNAAGIPRRTFGGKVDFHS